MGFIADTKIEGLGIEIRSESVRIYDAYGDNPTDMERHIFAGDYPSGEPRRSVEISKVQLKRLLEFFDKPENRRACEVD